MRLPIREPDVARVIKSNLRYGDTFWDIRRRPHPLNRNPSTPPQSVRRHRSIDFLIPYGTRLCVGSHTSQSKFALFNYCEACLDDRCSPALHSRNPPTRWQRRLRSGFDGRTYIRHDNLLATAPRCVKTLKTLIITLLIEP
jgi:hypothetical protein